MDSISDEIFHTVEETKQNAKTYVLVDDPIYGDFKFKGSPFVVISLEIGGKYVPIVLMIDENLPHGLYLSKFTYNIVERALMISEFDLEYVLHVNNLGEKSYIMVEECIHEHSNVYGIKRN